jgi:hypothetical protein
MADDRKIIIDVGSNSADLDKTIDKLQKMGVIDQKLADQFKKNNTDLQGQINNTTTVTQKLTDKIVDSSNKSVKAHEAHLGSVIKLGKGVAGIAGLLDVFGKALGLNMELLEGLSGAHRTLITSARDLHHITGLKTASTEANTVATEVNIVATEGATVAQEGLNIAMEANPIGGVILAMVALVGIISVFAFGSKECEEGVKAFNKAMEDEKKIIDALDDSIKDAIVDYKLLTGVIDEPEAKKEKLRIKANAEILKDAKKFADEKKEIESKYDDAWFKKLFVDPVTWENEKNEEIAELSRQHNIAQNKIVREEAILESKINIESANKSKDEIKKSQDKANEDNRRSFNELEKLKIEDKKKIIEAQAKIDEINAKSTISDQKALAIELVKIEDDKSEKIKDLDIKELKYSNDEYAVQAEKKKQIGTRAEESEKERHTKLKVDLLKIDQKFYEAAYEAAKKADEDLSKWKMDDAKLAGDREKIETLKKYNDRKLTKLQFDKEMLKDDEDQQKLIMEVFDKNSKEYLEAERRFQEDEKAIKDLEQKDMKDSIKNTADSMKEILSYYTSTKEAIINGNIKTIDHQESLQRDSIETQRRLAEQGKANTLAFEEKKQADLELQRKKEEKKLIKMKELEVFMNAIASFSKDDPKTALAKALAEIAMVKAAEASFMESGGIIGSNNMKSVVGFGGLSRRHSSGNDVLLHAEKGEGILSVKEMSNLGSNNFNFLKGMLKSPLNEKMITSQINVSKNDNKEIVNRLESLERTIKDKKETSVDWDSYNNMIRMNVTEMERGVKTITTHMNKKPRI